MKEFNWQQTAAKAAEGDMTAFEELYKQTEHTVYFTCLKLIGNEHDAKDVMQETYIKAFEKLPELSDFSKFPAWLNRIAVNNCKMLFRKPKDDYLEDMPEQMSELTDEDTLTPEDYVYDAEKRRVVMDIIDTKLSEAQRQTVILYYFNEMSVTEIAAVMECPEGTVKYRLSAARDKIREAVLIHEKKSGDRLHAVVPVPILTQILRKEAEETIVPKITLPKPKSSSPRQSGGSGGSMTNGGQTNMIKALQTKIIVGAAAAVIAGGGIAAAVALNKNADKPETDSSVVSIAETSSVLDDSAAPAESTAPEENSVTAEDSSSEAPAEPEPEIDESDLKNWNHIRYYRPKVFNVYGGTTERFYTHFEEGDQTFMIRSFGYKDFMDSNGYEEYGQEDLYNIIDLLFIERLGQTKHCKLSRSRAEIENYTEEECEILGSTFLRRTGVIHGNEIGRENTDYYYIVYGGIVEREGLVVESDRAPVIWGFVTENEARIPEIEGYADTIAKYAEWEE